MRRLAMARFWFAANAYSPLATGQADLQRLEWFRGWSGVGLLRDQPHELAGVLDFQQRRGSDWQVIGLRVAAARPGGPMADATFDRYLGELVKNLGEVRWDAVYLSLHGAARTAGRQQPELDLVAAVRRAVGAVPLGITLDPCANVTSELIAQVDLAMSTGDDPRDAALRTLEGLVALADGAGRPAQVLVPLPGPLPALARRPLPPPVAEVEALARKLVRGSVLDVALFRGWPWAGTPQARPAVLAIALDRDEAADAAEGVAAALWARRSRLAPSLLPPSAAIARALATRGPVAVLDAADDPLAGGTGDTPDVLGALLQSRLDGPALFAAFADPEVVAAAARAGAGATVACSFGARLTQAFGPAIDATAVVDRLTDGRFQTATGRTVDAGPTVLLRVGPITVVVAATAHPLVDPGWWSLHQLEPNAFRLVAVKAGQDFRERFADRFAAIVVADARGPASLDLAAAMAGGPGTGQRRDADAGASGRL